MLKTTKPRFFILGVVVAFCLILPACSGVTASVETDRGTLEFGMPANYGGSSNCVLPFQWGDGHKMSEDDLNYIMQFKVYLSESGGMYHEQNITMPITFASDPWEYALSFKGSCSEGREIFLHWSGNDAISLGVLK